MLQESRELRPGAQAAVAMNLRLFYAPVVNQYPDVLINYDPWLVCEWQPRIGKWYVLERHSTSDFAFESMMVGMAHFGWRVQS